MLGSAVAGRRVGVRSPVPLLLGGILAALLLILVVALPGRPPAPDPHSVATLNEREALVVVAQQMRSGAAAAQVLRQGRASFADGAWSVTVEGAQFHFTTRNRIVVPDNEAAVALQARDPRP